MSMHPINTAIRFLSALWIASAVVACSGGSEPANQTTVNSSQASSRQAASSSSNGLDVMVKAVAAAPGEQVIDVRYELVSRPELGNPVDITINLQGLSAVAEIKLEVLAAAGLEILAGKQSGFPSLKVGESQTHHIQVRGSSTGLKVLDLQLVALVDGVSRTNTFSIPLAFIADEAASSASVSSAK